MTWPATNPGPGAARGDVLPEVVVVDVVEVAPVGVGAAAPVVEVVVLLVELGADVDVDRGARVVVVVRWWAGGEVEGLVQAEAIRASVPASAAATRGLRRRTLLILPRRDRPRRSVWEHPGVLTSQLCTLASLDSPQLRVWSDRLRPMWNPEGTDPRPVMVHRKMWEWLFVCEALAERGMLQSGKRGLGFGVGREPLVALFASLGCEVMATDLEPERARAAGWTDTGDEYSGGLEGLCDERLCPRDEFVRRVKYRYVDMNDVPDDLRGFDFTWSSSAFEHLGSLATGAEFVVEQMRCLAPGGVAVHTTELNVSSDDRTVESGATVLYRRRDIEDLATRLRRLGYRIDIDLTEGDTPADRHVDVPPFSNTHLRTTLGEFITTSVGLVIEKPEAGPRRWWHRRSAR